MPSPAFWFVITPAVTTAFGVMIAHAPTATSVESTTRATPELADTSARQHPIPVSYEAALDELDRVTTDQARARLRKMDQRDLWTFHFGLGLGLRNAWVYPEGSPLKLDMHRLGIWDPDEISSTLIEGYWCRVNGGVLDLGPIPSGNVERVCWGRTGSPTVRTCADDDAPLTAWMAPLTNEDDKHDRLSYVGRCPFGDVWIASPGKPWRAPTKRELRRLRRADIAARKREWKRAR